jgi:acetyl-CoA carboxylase carboxyltransferase component
VRRQHDEGRLTIRERIDAVVDGGSFQEVGGLAGAGRDEGGVRKITPAPYVMGLAKVDGRDVAIGGEDFTVRGGSSWGGDRRKGGQGGFVEDLAYHYKIPLINLIDGAGGSVTTIAPGAFHPLGVDGFSAP